MEGVAGLRKGSPSFAQNQAASHELLGFEDGKVAAGPVSWLQQVLSITFRGAGRRRRCSGHEQRREFFHPATIEIRRCVQK